MSSEPKRPGRPRVRPELGPRVNVMFRLNADVRDRVLAEANAQGRSLSEMLERIVDQHFAAADMRAIVREEIASVLKIDQSAITSSAIALNDAVAGEPVRISFAAQRRGYLPS